MRRPAQTKAQRAHARERRCILRLRKASARVVIAMDGGESGAEPEAELLAAACAYADTLSPRELKKLAK